MTDTQEPTAAQLLASNMAAAKETIYEEKTIGVVEEKTTVTHDASDFKLDRDPQPSPAWATHLHYIRCERQGELDLHRRPVLDTHIVPVCEAGFNPLKLDLYARFFAMVIIKMQQEPAFFMFAVEVYGGELDLVNVHEQHAYLRAVPCLIDHAPTMLKLDHDAVLHTGCSLDNQSLPWLTDEQRKILGDHGLMSLSDGFRTATLHGTEAVMRFAPLPAKQ